MSSSLSLRLLRLPFSRATKVFASSSSTSNETTLQQKLNTIFNYNIPEAFQLLKPGVLTLELLDCICGWALELYDDSEEEEESKGSEERPQLCLPFLRSFSQTTTFVHDDINEQQPEILPLEQSSLDFYRSTIRNVLANAYLANVHSAEDQDDPGYGDLNFIFKIDMDGCTKSKQTGTTFTTAPHLEALTTYFIQCSMEESGGDDDDDTPVTWIRTAATYEPAQVLTKLLSVRNPRVDCDKVELQLELSTSSGLAPGDEMEEEASVREEECVVGEDRFVILILNIDIHHSEYRYSSF